MKVLIIDDDDLVRRSLSRALGRREHQVFEASNGHVGVDLWREKNPDLVFLDVLMPGLSGPDVLKAVGKDRSGKVILMSAYSGAHDSDSANRLGADVFIQKPFDDIFALIDRAEKLCER